MANGDGERQLRLRRCGGLDDRVAGSYSSSLTLDSKVFVVPKLVPGGLAAVRGGLDDELANIGSMGVGFRRFGDATTVSTMST